MKVSTAVTALLGFLAWAPESAAYRPFDSTDASVAARGELELELGIGYLVEGPEHFLVVPAVVVNLGLWERWELVVQGRNALLLTDGEGQPRVRIDETALLVKGILRDGTLQDGTGPSVAIETGALLPTLHGEPGLGATVAGIVSQRWPSITIHANVAASLTRSHRLDLFGGLIVEGPYHWAVRPVAEVFVEREFDTVLSYSGLVGAIWRVRENLTLDVAIRAARVNDSAVGEIRAGLTWAIGLG